MASNGTLMDDDKGLDVVSSVLNNAPFKIRPEEEKVAILKKGRPLPQLNIIKRDNNRNCNRTFQSSWYDIHKWLCGSELYNKLFCWPCLLMRPETSSWCSTGNDDMKRFTSLATKHAGCKSHMKAIAEYDEALTHIGLSPVYVQELNLNSKEDDTASEESDADGVEDLFNVLPAEKQNEKSGVSKTNLAAQTNPTKSSESNEVKAPKSTAKITFKMWKEWSRDRYPISRSRCLEDVKLFKWKRRIFRQELKNARLTGEKLKYEIEVLKAKAEYYKLIKDEVSPQNSVVNADATAVLQN